MNFLIQGQDGLPLHDFSFELIQSIKYQKRLGKERKYIISMDPEEVINTADWCPVGSVEFVFKYFDFHGIPRPKPINIPEELKLISGLRPSIEEEDTVFKGVRFVKSMDLIKHPLNGFMKMTPSEKGLWQTTDVVDFVSEWRCFIHDGRLIDCKNYIGDFDKPPSISYIKECIKGYKPAPIAYTLDVGVTKTGTCVIEVHDFFSCGLYGFSAPHIYPQMLSQWYYSYISRHPLNTDKIVSANPMTMEPDINIFNYERMK